MSKKLISVISFVLLMSLMLSACDISITINPTAEPVSVDPPLPEPTKVPEILNPTKPVATGVGPTVNNVSSHDLYAGFTGDSEVPFLILHDSGESIGIIQENNSSSVTGIIWDFPSEKSIVFYVDSNGRPTDAVVGEDIVHYTNYTNDTVDLRIIHPDGTQELLRTKLNTSLINYSTETTRPTLGFARHSLMDSFPLQQQYTWQLIDEGLFAIEVGACLGAAGAFALNIPALIALGAACHSPILELKIREGKAENIDVGTLEDIQDGLDLYGCFSGHVVDCINKFVRDKAEAEALANQKVANIPPLPAIPVPTRECKGNKYNCP